MKTILNLTREENHLIIDINRRKVYWWDKDDRAHFRSDMHKYTIKHIAIDVSGDKVLVSTPKGIIPMRVEEFLNRIGYFNVSEWFDDCIKCAKTDMERKSIAYSI